MAVRGKIKSCSFIGTRAFKEGGFTDRIFDLFVSAIYEI